MKTDNEEHDMEYRLLGRTGVSVSPLCLGTMMFGPDLVRQGKVRYIGSSSYSASQIVEAQWVSRDPNLARFVTEQPPYSILVRGIEEDVLPTVQRHGMGALVYSPLSGGWLTGRWRKGAPGTPASAAVRVPGST